MNKIRHWDNLTAKWLMRHFYFMFFQIVLVVIFFFWFINTLKIIDLGADLKIATGVERLLHAQVVNTHILLFLLLLNSFWLLFIFSSIQRLGTLLKDISFHLSRLRLRNKQ